MRAVTLACAALLTASANAQLQQPIHLDGGVIRGTESARHGVLSFKGIPFAAPPIGDLRWRAPQPVKPWKGIRAADHFADMCAQTSEDGPGSTYFDGNRATSEDCLYLNVWTPAKSANEKLSVMVWIHGGGFRTGTASLRFYDGADLAAKGVVVVSIQYRVGLFGFFAAPELAGESPQHAAGNYGIMDQVAALQWVQHNIAHFGGDPSQVTVFGQSAGGASACSMAATPLAKGLLARAISESGQILISPDSPVPLADAEKNSAAFMQTLGTKDIAAMRAMPVEKLLATNKRFPLTVDGYVFPKSGEDIYATGIENRMPIMMGSTGNELHSRATLAKYREHVQQQWGAYADEFLALYPATNDAEASAALAQSNTEESAFSEWEYAKLHTAAGNRAYLFLFTHWLPIPDGMYSMNNPGAPHGAEIDYVFDHLGTRPWPWSAVDYKLAETMSDYWVNFAKTGNPNGKGLPPWPAFDVNHPMEMVFGDTTQAQPVRLLKKFTFFEAHKELIYPPHY